MLQDSNTNQPKNPQNTPSQGTVPSNSEPAFYDPAANPAPMSDPYSAQPEFDTYNQPQNPDYSGDYTQDPYATYSQPVDQSSESTPTAPALDANSDQSQQGSQNTQSQNTFEQRKSGNKLFIILASIIVVVLLVAAGVLAYLNFASPAATNTTSVNNQIPSNTNTTNNNTVTQQPVEEKADNTETGGDGTAASRSRQFNVNVLPKEWLKQKFRTPNIDPDGTCLTINICGEQADPDKDGANNLIEYNFGTDPIASDTDRDGIADGDELFVYYINPTSVDSDSDTFRDGTELGNCYRADDSKPVKYDVAAQKTIADNVSLKPLHEPTITTMKLSNLTQEEISKQGLSTAACNAPVVTTTTTNSPTNTTQPTQTTNNPQLSGSTQN